MAKTTISKDLELEPGHIILCHPADLIFLWRIHPYLYEHAYASDRIEQGKPHIVEVKENDA
jgi:hypothetical protein